MIAMGMWWACGRQAMVFSSFKKKTGGQGNNMFQEAHMPIKIQSYSEAVVMSTQPDRNISCGYRKSHLCAQTTPGVYCMSSECMLCSHN